MRSVHVVLFAAMPSLASAQVAAPGSSRLQEYAVDAGHSIVEFSIGFAFTRVKGRFNSSKGTILYDTVDPARSSITVVIESKSIDTGWPHRDEHLRTSDFFDVEKYPTIVFQSDRMLKMKNGWRADGKLTMHGVTRAISIPFRLTRADARNVDGSMLNIDAQGELKLARADFGINGGSAFNSWFTRARAATMADSVEIDLEIEGWRADTEGQKAAIQPALERIKANGVQSLIDRYSSILKAQPTARLGLMNGGDLTMRALIASGRIEDAIKLSRAVTELLPAESRPYIVYGVALAMSGDTAQAVRQYARARDVFTPPVVDPNEKFPQVDDNWYYLDQLARSLVEMNKASIAVPVAKTVAALYSDSAPAQSTLGLVLGAAGEKNAAAAAYARALAIDPNETRALEYRRR